MADADERRRGASRSRGIEGSVGDFAWSPDGKYLALIVSDKQPDLGKTADGEEILAPIVVDRYRFKVDDVGILDNRRQRLFLYDLAARTMKRMTDGDYDEYLARPGRPIGSRGRLRLARVPRPGPHLRQQYLIIARVAAPGSCAGPARPPMKAPMCPRTPEPIRHGARTGSRSPISAAAIPS